MTDSIRRDRFEYQAFISYASEDSVIVREFVERIQRDGISVWIDREGMRSGPAVLTQLADGIERSAYLVAFVSDSYLSSNYAMAELEASRHRDVTDGVVRTIPVKLRPMTRELSIFDRSLTLCDLTGAPERSDREYLRLKQSIRAPVGRPTERVDPGVVREACEAPFGHRDQPDVMLFLIRQAAVALERFLYSREVGGSVEGLSPEALRRKLIRSGRISSETAGSLTVMWTVGDAVVNDRIAGTGNVSEKSIDDALGELRRLSARLFPDHPIDDRAGRVVAALPPAGDDGERLIPGTGLRLRAEPAGRTGVGPLFDGHDAASGEARSIVLADLPPGTEDAFLDACPGYAGLDAPELVVPLASGTADAGDGRRCPYVVFPAVRDVSVRELAEPHGGRLPVPAVVEIGLAVAHALASLPAGLTPDRIPAHDVRVGRAGRVRLLAIGPPADGDGAGPRAVADLLRELLTGVPDGSAPAGDAAERMLRRAADCRDADQLVRVLERAGDAPDGDGPGLRSLLPAPATTPAGAARTGPGPEPEYSHRVRSRHAWPLADGHVLTWEADGGRLAVLDGHRTRWRDDDPTPVRLAVTGRDGRVAVGGWNGAVRHVAGDGTPVVVTSLDGTVGDLAFAGDELVAGSWRHALLRLAPDGPPRPLLEADRGVHRIAMSRGGDRFAVADLSGRVAVYGSNLRVSDWRDVGDVSELAFAGSRLVLLTADGLKGVRPDDTVDGPRERAGAVRLLPGGDDTCVLLVAAGPPEAWTIDHEDRHIHRATFPAGARVLSACAARGRFTVGLPGGGCAYWEDGVQRWVWPTARAAELAGDGGRIAVTLPDRVDLYPTDA